MPLYLGLMSGTSMDGIDAVLLSIEPTGMTVRAAARREWPAAIVQRLRLAVERPAETGLDELGSLDAAVGDEFAAAALALLDAAGVAAHDVRAVGSHGQTIRHRPQATPPFTLQIGDPSMLAERLGIDVVADFRRRDVAAGGQGAPLAPAFHVAAFGSSDEVRAVVNIGGIANVTRLAPSSAVIGFDTGPGNCLSDDWARRRDGRAFDRDGAWAASGRVDEALLDAMLREPYFARRPPKSTGRELFNGGWIDRYVRDRSTPAPDVQATLIELTVRTIAAGLRADDVLAASPARRLLVCGGGAFNGYLMRRLAAALPELPIETTAAFGIAPDHVEAAAFAWLAHRRVCGLPGNLPSVTGATHAVPLGGIHLGRA